MEASIWHIVPLIFILSFYYLFCLVAVRVNKNLSKIIGRKKYFFLIALCFLSYFFYSVIITSIFERSVPAGLVLFVGVLIAYYFMIKFSLMRMNDAGIPRTKAYLLGIPLVAKGYMIYLMFKK